MRDSLLPPRVSLDALKNFQKREAPVNLDDITSGPLFRRFVIACACKEKALRFLDEHKGVTASSIFPDVEGLGRFLRWHLDSLLTTLL